MLVVSCFHTINDRRTGPDKASISTAVKLVIPLCHSPLQTSDSVLVAPNSDRQNGNMCKISHRQRICLYGALCHYRFASEFYPKIQSNYRLPLGRAQGVQSPGGLGTYHSQRARSAVAPGGCVATGWTNRLATARNPGRLSCGPAHFPRSLTSQPQTIPPAFAPTAPPKLGRLRQSSFRRAPCRFCDIWPAAPIAWPSPTTVY